MEKRKGDGSVVEPENFDPEAPSPTTVQMPGEARPVPTYPGDEDDSDDERDDENEAVPEDDEAETGD
jgi:hypothetical protein